MKIHLLTGIGLASVLAASTGSVPAAAAPKESCWGQATAVFARMGKMGEHASQQLNPRDGLRNLAVDLYEMGVLSEPTLAALGAFVAALEGLSIEACM